MLKESYVAKLKTLPKNAIKLEVGYPSVFAPSDTLLSEFNEIKNKLMKKGFAEPEARKRAWKQADFEKRFRKEIESKPDVIDRLKEIKKLQRQIMIQVSKKISQEKDLELIDIIVPDSLPLSDFKVRI